MDIELARPGTQARQRCSKLVCARSSPHSTGACSASIIASAAFGYFGFPPGDTPPQAGANRAAKRWCPPAILNPLGALTVDRNGSRPAAFHICISKGDVENG